MVEGQHGGFETFVLLRLARERLWLFGRPTAVSTHDPRQLRHGVADSRAVIWEKWMVIEATIFFPVNKKGDQEDQQKKCTLW